MSVLAIYYAHNCTNQPIYVTVSDMAQIEVQPGETAQLTPIQWLSQNVSFARKVDGHDLSTKVLERDGEMLVGFPGSEILVNLPQYNTLEVGMPIFTVYMPKADLPLCVVLNATE